MNHFWYSKQAEMARYRRFASAMDWGYVSSLDIPHEVTAEIQVAGEAVRMAYSLCGSSIDAYDKDGPCPVGWDDMVYLGEGDNIKTRDLTVNEIVERMQAMGMVVPTKLLEMARTAA